MISGRPTRYGVVVLTSTQRKLEKLLRQKYPHSEWTAKLNEETLQSRTASEKQSEKLTSRSSKMKTHLSCAVSAAAFTLGLLTLPTSASLQNDALTKIANYKQWTQVTQQLPSDSIPLNAASIGG